VSEESLAGRLLVATPTLTDPNFSRTVVLLLGHGDEGALGVVLNRRSEVPVGAMLPSWEEWVAPPAVVFAGGPVSPQAAIALARATNAVEGFAAFGPGLGTVDLEQDAALLGPQLAGLRVFAGYAGWGTGQLEGEIGAGAWYVVDALPGDGFSPDPEGLWRDVLRRQPGDLRLVASFPPDPTLN
jgi:putative transcriptional regulator